MLRTVHGVYLATLVIILYCGLSSSIQINLEDAVNLGVESFQVVEPLTPTKNDVEIIPEEDIELVFATVVAKWNQHEQLKKVASIEHADEIVKQRKTRQAANGQSHLYPKLPSSPYNPYQSQPPYNSPGQNPYQSQPPYNSPGQNPYQSQPPYNSPGQNPYQSQAPYNSPGQNPYQSQPPYNSPGQNPYQSQPPYNSPGQNPYQPQHSYTPPGQNPYQPQHSYTPPGQNQGFQGKYNSTQPGSHNNPSTGFYKPNQGSFNPYTGQNPYGPHPSYPTYNSTSSSSGISQRPPTGQYPYNQSSNYPHNTASFRPPNATGTGFSTPYPPYNPRPGVNNTYPGQPPYNSFYPPTSGNTHPVINLNSSSQRPPYYNPNQYPTNPHPNQPRWPNANSSYPNYPGGSSHHSPASTYSPQPPQNSPYYPGTRNQYPNKPNYPSSNSSAGSADTYFNPSMPNYPPHNNNNGQNVYDPRRVPPQNFSYH